MHYYDVLCVDDELDNFTKVCFEISERPLSTLLQIFTIFSWKDKLTFQEKFFKNLFWKIDAVARCILLNIHSIMYSAAP